MKLSLVQRFHIGFTTSMAEASTPATDARLDALCALVADLTERIEALERRNDRDDEYRMEQREREVGYD